MIRATVGDRSGTPRLLADHAPERRFDPPLDADGVGTGLVLRDLECRALTKAT